MFKLIVLLIISVLLGCNMMNPKFVIMKIKNDDISISWYYKSTLTSSGPEFVTVEKDGEEKQIYKAVDVVTNIILTEKAIIIKLYKPERGIVYTKGLLNEVFGYKIVLDSTSTYNEYLNIPKAVKE